MIKAIKIRKDNVNVVAKETGILPARIKRAEGNYVVVGATKSAPYIFLTKSKFKQYFMFDAPESFRWFIRAHQINPLKGL